MQIAQKNNDVVSDAELFAEIARQNSTALSTLYERYSPRLYGLALKILQDQGLAEDVLQDLFMYLWQNAAQFDQRRGNPVSWMMILCRNRSIDKLRAKQRKAARSTEINEDILQKIGADESESPLEYVHQGEVKKTITDALAQLQADQRIPIELAYFEGLSQSEIANRLEQPLGTVKTRVRLGMQKLRSLIK